MSKNYEASFSRVAKCDEYSECSRGFPHQKHHLHLSVNLQLNSTMYILYFQVVWILMLRVYCITGLHMYSIVTYAWFVCMICMYCYLFIV